MTTEGTGEFSERWQRRSGVERTLLNLLLGATLFSMIYSAAGGMVQWQDLNPRLPNRIEPFETWPMFKRLLRSEPVLRLEGETLTGTLETIPSSSVFGFRSLEGRTLLEMGGTFVILRADSVMRRRMSVLAQAIAESVPAQSGRYRTIAVVLDTFDVLSGKTFASSELLRIEISARAGSTSERLHHDD